jgi:uncharacterized protein YjbI with pentapeptide repeats
MANARQLSLLKAGVKGWNTWRGMNPEEQVDLTGADLRGADLGEADLRGANLQGAQLIRADLRGADLYRADLSQTDLTFADLTGADLRGASLLRANLRANFSQADLRGANLSRADLNSAILAGADLREAFLITTDLLGADLREADLRGANLTGSTLIGVNVNHARISGSSVYGVNVLDVEGEFEEQKDLIITREHEPPITVDNIKVAQFVYLILNNKEIRDVFNIQASRTVLILGRFAIPGRKAILNRLRDGLREYDLLPIAFDFDRPVDKDFTETIKTLASISYFVIADVTNPKSSPLELQAAVPDYQIPFVPILQEGEQPFAMMKDLRKYGWVLDTISYDSPDTLIEILKPQVIDPAIRKRDELRLIKAREPAIISGRELREQDKNVTSPSSGRSAET